MSILIPGDEDMRDELGIPPESEGGPAPGLTGGELEVDTEAVATARDATQVLDKAPDVNPSDLEPPSVSMPLSTRDGPEITGQRDDRGTSGTPDFSITGAGDPEVDLPADEPVEEPDPGSVTEKVGDAITSEKGGPSDGLQTAAAAAGVLGLLFLVADTAGWI